MKTKNFQTIHITIFLAFIFTLGVMTASKIRTIPYPEKFSDVLAGKYSKALEDLFEEHFTIKQVGINLWAALEYTLFKEGKNGLVIGNDDWLFTAEEFNVSTNSVHALEKNIEFISWVNSKFKQRGIQLVVVPVPAKARVYGDKLFNRKPAKLHNDLYQTMLTKLSASDIKVTDSLSVMSKAKNSTPLFLRSDTHWTPAGANLVALETASYLKNTMNIKLDTQVFTTEVREEKSITGDLVKFLPLSPMFSEFLPEAEIITVGVTYQSDLDDLFGSSAETGETIALVGTSYSANSDWNFDGALKQALGTDVINYARQGLGPLLPMVEFINQHVEQLKELELVIWEIPERYMTNFYSDVYAVLETDSSDLSIAHQFNLNQETSL